MRIAICFSGQLRTGIESSPSLLNFIGDLLPDCDFFVHTWDINSFRPILNMRVLPVRPSAKVLKNDYDTFFNIYKPKNVVIEEDQMYWDHIIKNYGDTGDLIHLWHSFYYSIQLKKIHENLNNFKYDIVIKLRPDCIFPPDRFLKDDISEFLEKSEEIDILHLDDVYMLSSSEGMDKSIDFYGEGNLYGYKDWPMKFFLSYLDGKNIKIDEFDDRRWTILRQEYSELNPITEYYQISLINSYLFEDIRFAKNSHVYTFRNVKNPNWIPEMKEIMRSLFDVGVADEFFNLNNINNKI